MPVPLLCCGCLCPLSACNSCVTLRPSSSCSGIVTLFNVIVNLSPAVNSLDPADL